MIYCIHRLVCSAIIRSNKNAHIFVVLPFWTVALGIQMVLNLVRFSFPVNREHFDIFYVCGNEIDSTKKKQQQQCHKFWLETEKKMIH